MCSSGPLRLLSALIGLSFAAASVVGVGLSLYLLFGEPLGDYTRVTYTPSAEDVGRWTEEVVVVVLVAAAVVVTAVVELLCCC